MTLEKISTDNAPAAIGPYSQAVKSGDHIFLSGQLPIDPATGKIVEGGIEIQVNRVLGNLQAVLKAANCTFDDVVRCDVFLMDLNDFGVVNREYAKRFNQPTPPARQTIQVSRLPMDALVEISCIAVSNN